MLIALVGVGEETGMLDVLLPKAAEYFESDVAAAIATSVRSSSLPYRRTRRDRRPYRLLVFIPLYSLIGSVSQ